MSRRCMITGKGVMSGNNVSHAENRTRRKWLPNIKDANIYSEALKRWVRIRVTPNGLRTIEHKGGLDAYLADTAKTKLDPVLRPLKAQIEKKAKAQKA
ncbi:MAG: 50S ribosomal protein L28 [Alphaproteobacteria bacterium]